jgi:succinoglycan biosynthesis transport protein ExoP
MSKFFDETLKTRNPSGSEPGFNLAGLEEIESADEQTDLKGNVSDVPHPEAEQSRKVEIPHSMLLPSQFQGSDSLQCAEEAYRALRTRLLRLCSARRLRSIVVTSSVPGEGKTLTSFNLALSCSQLQDMRVLLIDGDIRTAGLTRSLGFALSPGLADTLSGQCSFESAILDTGHPTLSVYGAGSTTLPPAELYAGERWQKFVQSCSKSFDLMIIDSPPIMSLSDVDLMTAACDGVLLIVRAGHTRRDILQKFANQLDAKKLLGIVYNFSEGTHHKYTYSTGER